MTARIPARHRLLGAALRRFRTESGYSLGDAAAVLACHRSKVSRMETGQRGIDPADCRDLLDAYGVDEPRRDRLLVLAEHGQDDRWWRSGSYGADAYQDLLRLSGPGAAMWVYEAQFIPRPLQTEDYARGIADAALAGADRETRERFVRDRLLGIQGADALRLSVILSEGALRQIVGSRGVMVSQLRHLGEVSGKQPMIAVQVLPFATGAVAAASGPFTIITFPGPQDVSVVRLAGQTTSVYMEDDEDAERYATIFQHLRAAALPPEESAQLIEAVADEFDEPPTVG